MAPATKRSGKPPVVIRRLAAHNRPQDTVCRWAGVAARRDLVSQAKYAALCACGHGHARALCSVGDWPLGVACAMQESRTLFDPACQSHAQAT